MYADSLTETVQCKFPLGKFAPGKLPSPENSLPETSPSRKAFPRKKSPQEHSLSPPLPLLPRAIPIIFHSPQALRCFKFLVFIYRAVTQIQEDNQL